MTTQQPDSIRLVSNGFDAVEVMDLGDHYVLLQVTEDGDSETLSISREQAKALSLLILDFQPIE